MMDKSIFKKLEATQRKFLKAIKLNRNLTNHDNVFDELKIVKVAIRVNVNMLKSFNRIVMNQGPSDLYRRIKTNSEVRDRNLRFGCQYKKACYKSQVGRKSFMYLVVDKYNDLQKFINAKELKNNNFVNNCILFCRNK